MGVTELPWDLHKEAARDSQRHQDRLRGKIKDQIKGVIGNENIITGDGSNKGVRVPIKGTDTWRFIFDPRSGDDVAQGDGDTQEGDIIGAEPEPGSEKAGNDEGEGGYEVEISLDEVVDMMLEDLSLPRLEPKKAANITVDEVVWNDVAKRGAMSNLHKKRTIIENIKRNATTTGEPVFKDIKEDDLRFRSWNINKVPITSAVVIAMMDVSGSMGENKKYVARSFFFWMVQFLKRKYEQVEIVFITHTSTAKIVDENEFFHTMESGGTVCSSAYEKAEEVLKYQYDLNVYNAFAFHFSDGDTWGDDVERSILSLKRLCDICNMVGYGEIRIDDWDFGTYEGFTTLYREFTKALGENPKFVAAEMTSKTDVYPALKRFFGDDDEKRA